MAKATEAEKPDFVYLAVGVVGSFPEDHDLTFQGQPRSSTSISPGVGLNIKAAVFPSLTGRIVGVEIESTGHSGRLQFPLSPGVVDRSGSSALTVFSTMANLVVQYPGRRWMPYAGVGMGWATGALTDTDIPTRRDRGLEASSAVSYQVIGGIRTRLADHLFLFGEYKHLVAHFHWTQLALDFRSHYAVVGVGYAF